MKATLVVDAQLLNVLEIAIRTESRTPDEQALLLDLAAACNPQSVPFVDWFERVRASWRIVACRDCGADVCIAPSERTRCDDCGADYRGECLAEIGADR